MGISVNRCRPNFNPKQRNSTFLTIECYCLKNTWNSRNANLREKRCPVFYRCKVKELPKSFPVKMTVEQIGSHDHNSNNQIARRQITGKLRKDFETRLAHQTPQQVLMSQDFKVAAQTGDHTKCPNLGTLSKIKSNSRISKLHDNKPGRDLEMFAAENPNIIREYNNYPYRVSFFSNDQIDICEPHPEAFHMDSTGNVCSKAGGKAVHLYSGVIRGCFW